MCQLVEHLLFVAGIILPQIGIDKRSVNASRGDAIATDVVRQIVASDRIRHGDHRTLAHRVSETVGQAGGPGDRREVQNHSSTRLLHMSNDRVHTVVEAFDVYSQDAIEVFGGSALDGSDMGDSGVVDEDVNASVLI